MANSYSNKHNPVLQNVDRPFTELFQLLPLLGSIHSEKRQQEILEAIQEHAENANLILLSGMQSLGVILATAADNKEMGVNLKDIKSIGWLLSSFGDLSEICFKLKELRQ